MSNANLNAALLRMNLGRSLEFSISPSEMFAVNGNLYRYSLDFSYTASQERFFTFQTPSGYAIGIAYRTLSSDFSGVEFARMSGTVATVAQAIGGFSALDGSAAPTPINLMNTPTVAGTVQRVPIYTGAGGGSTARTAGTTTADLGPDFILSGVQTCVRVKNNHNATQRIIVEIGLVFLP